MTNTSAKSTHAGHSQSPAQTHGQPALQGQAAIEAGPAAENLPIVGIWQLGRPIHQGTWAHLSFCQPADAAGSPRFDYVIRQASNDEVEAKRQIKRFVAAASAVIHPNVVPVLDASCDAVRPYLVTPRIKGVTMGEHLVGLGRKPLPVALWLVRQLSQALGALHVAGWVHGDVKPSNVLVGSRGHVTLIDLGFASQTHTLAATHYRGTPQYSSPESLVGNHAAIPAMDMFSLGKILWQWLTHVQPIHQGALEAVAALVERLVDSDPAARPTASQTTDQLLKLELQTLGRHINAGTDSGPPSSIAA